MEKKKERSITVFVSSAVYGLEPLLNQIYAALEGFGYEVWMSHKGTVPIYPALCALDSCLKAVRECHVFLGLITGRYGSGREKDGLSITHRELLFAIEQRKMRWFLVHRDVEVARQILKQFRYKKNGQPKNFDFRKTPVLEDKRVLDMYEAAVRFDVPLSERDGNWVQQFISDEDVLRFLDAQFSDQTRIRNLLRETADKGRSSK